MKNIQFLLLSLIVFMNIINADTNLKVYKNGSPINIPLQNGDNVHHILAKECQIFGSINEINQKRIEILNKYLKQELELGTVIPEDMNPFIPNKDGKTVREIAKEVFKKTGSLTCKAMADAFRDIENEFLNKL